MRLTLALTADDVNYFCHCGPSYHLLCKMLSYRTCSSGHILCSAPSACPSHLHQPQLPFLGKMEQRGFTSFQSILIQPFRGCRNRKHLTNAFNLGLPQLARSQARRHIWRGEFFPISSEPVDCPVKAHFSAPGPPGLLCIPTQPTAWIFPEAQVPQLLCLSFILCLPSILN